MNNKIIVPAILLAAVAAWRRLVARIFGLKLHEMPDTSPSEEDETRVLP